MSSRSISRLFKKYLTTAPQILVKSKSNVHLLIDGTYLPNGLCLILYYDHDIRYVQLYRTSSQEKFREIYQDLKALKALLLSAKGIVITTPCAFACFPLISTQLSTTVGKGKVKEKNIKCFLLKDINRFPECFGRSKQLNHYDKSIQEFCY